MSRKVSKNKLILFAIAAALVLVLCATMLVACGDKNNNDDDFEIKLMQEGAHLDIGVTIDIDNIQTYFFDPYEPDDKSVRFTSSDVEETCVILRVIDDYSAALTGVGDGVATITITSNANETSVQFHVMVGNGASGHTHQMTKVDGIAATCFLDGQSEHYECGICGKMYKDIEGKHLLQADTYDEELRIKGGHKFENGVCTVCHAPVPTEGIDYYGPRNKTVAGYRYDIDAYSVLSAGGVAQTKIVIDSSATHYVDQISGNAFAHNEIVEEVYIPETVETIGAHAFEGCTNLKKVYIPDSVIEIKENAFSGCALESVRLPAHLERVARSAFGEMDTLTKVEYYCETSSLSYTSTDDNSARHNLFQSCPVTDLTIGANVKEIQGESLLGQGTKHLEKLSFEGSIADWCKFDPRDYLKVTCDELYIAGELADEIVITSDVDEIVVRTFDGCKSLTSVTFENGLTTIGAYAFTDTDIASLVLPESMRTISESAFENCASLTSVTLNAGLETIESNAFKNCATLSSVNFNGGPSDTIWNNAFSGCEALNIQKLSIGTKYIYSYAFEGCHIQEVELNGIEGLSMRAFSCGVTKATLGSTLQYIEEDVFSGEDVYDNFELHFEGTLTQWCNAFNDSFEREVVNGKITSFYLEGGSEPVTELVIPAEVTTIYPFTFYNMIGIQKVSVPATVESIGHYAFSSANSNPTLTELTVPVVPVIGGLDLPDLSFLGHIAPLINGNGYVKVTLIDGDIDGDTIRDYFMDELVIEEGVDSVADDLEINVSKLTVRTPNINEVNGSHQSSYNPTNINELTIGPNANGVDILNMTGLTSLTFENGLTSIGRIDNINLETIAIPQSVTSVEAIVNCANLLTVNFPQGFVLSSGLTFEGCPKYTGERYIGELVNGHFYVNNDTIVGVKDIDGFAVLPSDNKITKIAAGAFDAATSLKYVYIPQYITTIPDNAFQAGVTVFEQALDYYHGSCTAYIQMGGNGCTDDGWMYDIFSNSDAQYVRIVGYIGEGGEVTVPDKIRDIPVKEILSNVDGNGSTKIKVSAFLGRSDITKLTFKSETIEIGNNALVGLSNLTTITLASTVRSFQLESYITTSSLQGCNSLTEIVLEGGYDHYKFSGTSGADQTITDGSALCSKFRNSSVGVGSVTYSA